MDAKDDEQQLLLAPLLAAAQNGIGSDNGEGSKATDEVHRLFATGEARDAADWDRVACYEGIAGFLTESWQTSARARTPAERETAASLVRQANEVLLYAKRWPEVSHSPVNGPRENPEAGMSIVCLV